ncbi:hypothetical protein [uncultured Porphyromonas sp.]|uniref:hypothetical protein n=1 Tax=uncultured Porphyromonas sp. TaxID=159274 RepID=UPI0025D1CA0E|nr:hypothetical protein [uncultured Porphyromonas sp.]
MTDLQSGGQKRPHMTISSTLYPIGLIACALGAILHIWLPQVGGWTLFAGGLLIIISHISDARRVSTLGVRAKRLMRMNFLGAAMYMIAGGSAVEGRSMWILFFVIGTVFVAYTFFALSHTEKENKL